jgi:hypothetical protein
MAFSPVSLSIRKICFYNNDEKTDMLLIYGEYKKNSFAAPDVYKPMVDTSNTFYINLICSFIC